MKYFEIRLTASVPSETAHDIFCALASEAGAESFETFDDHVKAYAQQDLFDKELLDTLLDGFPMEDVTVSYEVDEAEDKDWNAEWEKNFFQPIVIGGECVIHSTFHNDVPKAKYDIIINPQMAFGTGHHETTSLVIGQLIKEDLKGKRLLDMGCGTSILAILSSMRGADPITAIDIDDWCVNNSLDNMRLNNISNVNVFQGDASSLEGMEFDYVIANINRNILLEDMKRYAKTMHKGSVLIMSGFYREDLPLIEAEAVSLSMRLTCSEEKNRWTMARFIMD